MSPCDKVVNVPQTFLVQDTTWTPKSTDRDDWIGQTVTLKWGLTKSSNNISAYLMKQARRWSDRYRVMKNRGASEAEIRKSFSEKTKMRVFSWNKKGYIDTLMTPDDSIRYYKSHLRAAFMAIEPHTGHIKAYVGGPNYRYLLSCF